MTVKIEERRRLITDQFREPDHRVNKITQVEKREKQKQKTSPLLFKVQVGHPSHIGR